jgi:hypothetical protein
VGVYKTKIKRIPGTNYDEIHKDVRRIYKKITSTTKRRAYIRSAYFKGQKIFLNLFWQHIFDKVIVDRVRRLKQYPCALDLIKNSKIKPLSLENPSNPSEILHRFAGRNGNNQIFYVQIKEDKKSGEKSLVSVFPAKE